MARSSLDGQWLYYRRAGGRVPIYRIHPDGTGDELWLPDVSPYLGYAVTKSGVWFASPPTATRRSWALMLKSFDTGVIREAATMDFAPYLELAVSPDERYAILTKPDTRGTDLFLVRGFR